MGAKKNTPPLMSASEASWFRRLCKRLRKRIGARIAGSAGLRALFPWWRLPGKSRPADKQRRIPGSLCIEVHALEKGKGFLFACMDRATGWLFAWHAADASAGSMDFFFQKLCHSWPVRVRRVSVLDTPEGRRLRIHPAMLEFCRVLGIPCVLAPNPKFPQTSARLRKAMAACSLPQLPEALRQHVHACNHTPKKARSAAGKMQDWYARHPHLFVSPPEVFDAPD